MTDLAIVLGLTFFLLCLIFVVWHSLRRGRLTLIDWAMLGMGGVYGAGWALVVFVTREGGNPTWEKWLLPFEYLYPVHTIAAMILSVSVWFGWLLLGPLCFRRRKVHPLPSNSYETKLITTMWLLLVVAFVMQWLYTQAYGGFIGLLEYSASIRSAIFTVENRLSFFRSFGGLALFASFGFFGLWLSRCRSLAVWVGLFLSVGFSLYLLYSRLGRIGFLVYLATFILGAFLSRRPRPFVLLMGGGSAMLAIVIGAYYLSLCLNLKPADSLPAFLAKELSFPFGSFFAQLDLGEHLFRAFKDFLVAPVYLLPSSLWSQWVENVGQINTAVIMGAPKGEQGVTGGIPVDLLTLGFMQASVFGVAVVGIIFGALLRLSQCLLDGLANPGVRAVFGAYVALKIAVLGIFYAQPALVIKGNFDLLLTAIAIVIVLKAPRFWWCAKRRQRMPEDDSDGFASSTSHSLRLAP
jgi:hypothetical protein